MNTYYINILIPDTLNSNPNLSTTPSHRQPDLTFLEVNMCDDGPAEWTGGIGGVVLCQGPQTRFTEDVVAGSAHVGTKVHIQTRGADVAVPVPGAHILIFTTAGWVPC